MKKAKKIAILGAGNVGATIAYTLTIDKTASEIVLIDINKDKALGEAMDILQGTAFAAPINIYAGEYEDAAGSDIVIVTMGAGRKPGMTRIDLAKSNVELVKEVIPKIEAICPDAVYIIVSNPVDIITYTFVKHAKILKPHQIIGSGTTLDSTRLRTLIGAHVGLSPKDVNAYTLGEHGDSIVVPWSLITIAGMPMGSYCTGTCHRHNGCGKVELKEIEDDVRTAGARVISAKGATYYAIAMSVRLICEMVIRDTGGILTVSSGVGGAYGLPDVCLSLPFVLGAEGIRKMIKPPLDEDEQAALMRSGQTLKEVIEEIGI